MTQPGAAGAAWFLDRVVGEPPTACHPVAWFGTMMNRAEARLYRPSRGAGTFHTAVGIGTAAGVGLALDRLAGPRSATLVATYVSVAGRMLDAEAGAVLDAVEAGDLVEARQRVRSLVGRDTSELDSTELIRATVESLAENTVDAVVAPVIWAAVGGTPAVLAHRAINTLDAMVGHKTPRYERFGWAAARLDDLANYVPARVAAAVVAALNPDRRHQIIRAVRDDAPAHPSPNGGVIEAAVAGALGVELGGTNRYAGITEERGTLGSGRQPTIADGRRAQALCRRVGMATAVAALAVGLARRH